MWTNGITATPEARHKARGLRHHQKPAERWLWQELRGKRICGVRFHRRKAVLHYVPAFYCPRAKVAIYLDQEPVPARDGHLRSHGVLTIYFTSAEIFDQVDQVKAAILETVKYRSL